MQLHHELPFGLGVYGVCLCVGEVWGPECRQLWCEPVTQAYLHLGGGSRQPDAPVAQAPARLPFLPAHHQPARQCPGQPAGSSSLLMICLVYTLVRQRPGPIQRYGLMLALEPVCKICCVSAYQLACLAAYGESESYSWMCLLLFLPLVLLFPTLAGSCMLYPPECLQVAQLTTSMCSPQLHCSEAATLQCDELNQRLAVQLTGSIFASHQEPWHLDLR